MKNELLLLNRKLTDESIEHTKKKPKETFDFKLKKIMDSF